MYHNLLTTTHGTQEIDTKAVDGLMASHFQENEVSLALPRTYVRRQIPADRDEIPRPERVRGWPHLKQISKHIPAYMDSVVRLLIGLNCPGAVRPRDVICRNENDPYAVRSLLGWYVNCPVRHKSSKRVHCNRIQILKNTDDEVKGNIVGERMIKEQLTPQVVSQMFELDFAEREHRLAPSREDGQFLKIVEEGIRLQPDLSSKLTGVLTRYRKERVVFMTDVEKVFLQVKVKKEDQNFFRFLWWLERLNSRTSRVLYDGTSFRSWFITRMFQLWPETPKTVKRSLEQELPKHRRKTSTLTMH